MTGDDQATKTFSKQEVEARWAKIADKVEAVWAEIIAVADNVLKAHAKFGFDDFASRVHPSLEEILFSLQVVKPILDALAASKNVDYSEIRIMGNAKQQILWIETIGNALKYGNETDYLNSIEKLGNQSKH